jgi:hypothetical protein
MFRKKLVIFLIILISISSVKAYNLDDLKTRIDDATSEVQDFFGSVPKNDLLIVVGKRISFEDKILFNLIKAQVQDIQGIEIDSEDQISNEKYENKYLILLGGKKTNSISKKLLNENKVDSSIYSPIIIEKGVNNNKKFMILYSEKEKINKQNYGIKKSPLNGIMDEKFIPIVATSISIFFLYLWNVLAKTFTDLFSDFVSSKFLDKKTKKSKIKKKKVHKIKAHEFINISEVIAFILYVVIFSLTLSWSWSENFLDFKRILLINLIVVGVISFAREFVRLIFCYKQKLRSEYVFWPFGTFLTLLSTYIGNTFAMISYTLLDEDEADEKKFGRSSFLIALFTYFIAVISYILNMINPTVFLQMMFVFSIMILFIELFPMHPMPGFEIKEWNFIVWLISYIIIFLSYISMNFTIYV